jgi:hypothetical protein
MFFNIFYYTKRRQIQKWTFRKIRNGIHMFEYLKLNVMHPNIIVIQVLDKVCNVTFAGFTFKYPYGSMFINAKQGM